MKRLKAAILALVIFLPTNLFVPNAHAATLLVTIDPGNASSYPGSGSTVTDLTSSLSGTMSGVTYDGVNNCGVFTFGGGGKISFPTTNFGTQFSISAWVQPTSDAYSIQTLISNAGANTATTGFKAYWNSWNSYDHKMLVEHGNGSTGGATLSSAAQVTINAWQHLVFTFDTNSRAITMYKNGSLVANDGTLLTSGINTNQSWWLGSIGGNSYYMNAKLGVVKIYSTVLTAGEVSSDYNSTSARYAATPTCPAPAAPSNSAAPTISGTTTYNSVLTASTGTWSGSPTYAYQWQSASTSGGTYSNISGATSSTYTLASADVGQYIKVNVTATNAGGSTSALSAATSQIGKATQASFTHNLSSSGKAYPYSELVTFTPSGGSGSGAVTYAISSGGSATGCALSADTATVTVSASTSGTCFIQATKAADNNYNLIAGTPRIYTFSKTSGSLSFATTSYSKMYAETVTVLATGLGSGAITYSKGASTACDVNTTTGVVTITAGSGTCTISASIAADANYLTANSSNTVSISVARAYTSASITFAPGDLVFRTAKLITVSASVNGKVSFKANNVRIAGCTNLLANSSNSYTVSCSYKPSIRNGVMISVTLDPTDSAYISSVSSSQRFTVLPRASSRT